MRRIVCAYCEGETFTKINPDEDTCNTCGKTLENFNDYKAIEKYSK